MTRLLTSTTRLQFLRFALVGGAGTALNLLTFAFLVHGLGVDYRIAGAAGFAVALANIFWWNRLWTFDAGDGHVGGQAARFAVVNFTAFCCNSMALQVLVQLGDAPKLPAQALAIALATPVSFLGHKLWSFDR